MKLTKILTIKAELHCESGLHIGAGDMEMHIGGIDNQVIRDPVTQRPYIPGSSLKGKIRSLLEWRTGAIQSKPLSWFDYRANGDQEDILQILQLFGTSGSDKLTEEEARKVGPSRLSFWDCQLNKAWRTEMDQINLPTLEVKSENTIDRITAKANPRWMERVVSGAVFDFRLSLKVLDNEAETLLKTVFAGLRLLERDSLGGSGSRGYGKVKFKNVTVNGVARQADFEQTDPFA